MSRGFAVIISAPSGTGKSTICRKLLARDKSLRYSISCTTRDPRPGEKHGRDYYFLTHEEFKRKIHRDEFLEWAIVHGQYYGTPKRFLDEQIAEGNVVILAIDVQGANAIRRKRPHTTAIFLVPPSWRSLRERLRERRQDPKEAERRLASAREELHQAKHYEYMVVNDDLSDALEHIEAIITAEKLKVIRHDLNHLDIAELSLGRHH